MSVMVDRLVVVTLNSRNSGGPILFFSFLMSSVCNLSLSKIAAQKYRIVSYLMLKVFVRVRPLHVNHCCLSITSIKNLYSTIRVMISKTFLPRLFSCSFPNYFVESRIQVEYLCTYEIGQTKNSSQLMHYKYCPMLGKIVMVDLLVVNYLIVYLLVVHGVWFRGI